MTNLTNKQRAKVNAALCIIHDNGGDAGAVTALAQTIMATGHDKRTAYEKALNSFAAENPDFTPAITKMVDLIEASSDRTVAAYDSALSEYIATGDGAAMVALAPTIARDSIALAIHNGELTEAEAATGGVAQALGFDPGPVLQTSIDAPAQPPSPATPAIGLTDAPANGRASTDSQVSLASGAGYVPPVTAARWNDAPYIGLTSKSAAPLSLPNAPNGLPSGVSA